MLKEKSLRKKWEILEINHASKMLTNHLKIKMDLYYLKMEEVGNVIDHSNRFNELVFRLENAREILKLRSRHYFY